MIRKIACFVFLLVPCLASAQLESQFVFNGQNAEVLTAEKKVTVTVEEEVSVPSMCARRVPYQENVCRNETRYRQSCQRVPSRQECSEEPQYQCRTVTRTEEQCTGSESRTVCVERPTREICRTKPNGQQHCTTVGGGESCHEVPGNQVCRDVSYQDEECDTTYERVCRTIPASNECSQVPYEERVCGMETRYRTESYACNETQRVSKQVEKTLKSETSVQILTNGIVEEFPVKISVKEKDQSFKEFAATAILGKEPKAFVVQSSTRSKVTSSKEEILVKNTIVLEVMTQEMLPISFPSAIEKASLDQASSKLIVEFNEGIAPSGSVSLSITHKGFLRSTKTIAEFKGEYPSVKIEVGTVGEKPALMIDLKDSIVSELQKKNMRLKFELSSQLNLPGTILNTKKPATSKLYEGNTVQLK